MNTVPDDKTLKTDSPAWSMVGGVLAAIGASLCCAGPFVLLMLGISGSWISTLGAFYPLRPYFIVLVVGLFLWAGWKVYRPLGQCSADRICAVADNRRRFRILFWLTSLIAAMLATSPYWLVWMMA
ncbi:MerT mercuric transport protein [Shewanella psychrophila]|uniref:Mercuric transport protein MerT n=1 Tax=Shewanella psychrophila TaxID=225848 RepID=A0A1S6HUQ7_9GAMM|nr:mercuric transporter MerT family protein [Shewanella psychrophila]AQS39296.1 MerT mercuric transport protein [Shewanella psychrophila]